MEVTVIAPSKWWIELCEVSQRVLGVPRFTVEYAVMFREGESMGSFRTEREAAAWLAAAQQCATPSAFDQAIAEGRL